MKINFAFELFPSCDGVVSCFSAPSHDFHYIYGCYESIDVRVDVVIDEEVAGYADFSNKEIMWVMPHLPQYVSDLKKRGYEIAKDSITHCHSVLGKAKKADPDAPIRQGTAHDTVYAGQHSTHLTHCEVSERE